MAAAMAAALSACARSGPIDTDIREVTREPLVVTEGRITDMVRDGQGGRPSTRRPDQGIAGNVNRFLWRASLDTLSFLPIASTDPFSGVIATDWATSPGSPDERFKVTAYITDVTLDPTSLRVAVFRETLNGAAWVPAPVAGETPRQIEDAILVRARQLRLEERQAAG
ncbi:MAG: DUF3576 domain-containing protein [Rhodobacteraceae bacterium]|nr:MAG: DUF3576 domain-containing protein [Paracoccaceae bacterium]